MTNTAMVVNVPTSALIVASLQRDEEAEVVGVGIAPAVGSAVAGASLMVFISLCLVIKIVAALTSAHIGSRRGCVQSATTHRFLSGPCIGGRILLV